MSFVVSVFDLSEVLDQGVRVHLAFVETRRHHQDSVSAGRRHLSCELQCGSCGETTITSQHISSRQSFLPSLTQSDAMLWHLETKERGGASFRQAIALSNRVEKCLGAILWHLQAITRFWASIQVLKGKSRQKCPLQECVEYAPTKHGILINISFVK